MAIDNGQWTVDNLSGDGERQARTSREDKTVRPARGGPRGYPYYGMYIQKYTETDGQKIAGGRSADCMRTGLTNRDSLVCLTCGHLMRTSAIKLPALCEAGESRP